MVKKGIQKILNSDAGHYVISILLGLGLATLFRKSCKNRNCLVFKAASNKNIKDKIYKVDDKCYTFTTENIKCGSLEKQIEFN